MNFNEKSAAESLLQLPEIQKSQANEMALCVEDNDPMSSESEQDTECPIYEGFVNTDGAENISIIISFSPSEVNPLYENFCEEISETWCVERSDKLQCSTFNVCFFYARCCLRSEKVRTLWRHFSKSTLHFPSNSS